MSVYFTLFYEFLKIGLFSIGGGMATMPFLYDLADKYTWFTPAMLVDMIAISESTPGPIGINMATYAGYSAGGILGGAVATFALILPSIFIMLFVVRVLTVFKENKYVKSAFYGLRPAVTALIMYPAIDMVGITLLDLNLFPSILSMIKLGPVILLAALLAVSFKFEKVQSVFLIIAAAVIGMIFKF